MASEEIKHIAGFSSDGIEQAIERTLTKEEKTSFTRALHKISLVMDTPATKRNKLEKHLPDSQEIFNNYIIPRIRQKLNEYEQNQLSGRGFKCVVDLDYAINFHEMNPTKLKLVHAEIQQHEIMCGSTLLLIQYHRGCCYLAAYSMIDESTSRETFFTKHFSVCYATAMRYLSVAALIKRFPMLLACELTFDQLLKHSNALITFMLKDTEGLRERLSNFVEFGTKSRLFHIESSEIQVPCLRKVSSINKLYYIFLLRTMCHVN